VDSYSSQLPKNGLNVCPTIAPNLLLSLVPLLQHFVSVFWLMVDVDFTEVETIAISTTQS